MYNDSRLKTLGISVMNTLQPGLADNVIKYLENTDEGLSVLVTDYVFGSVVARDGLDLKTREMVTIASLISLGNATGQLELHMKAALNVGVSQKELLEVVIQMAIYTGIPAFMNALHIYHKVLGSQSTE